MKKFLVISLAVILSLCLVGCKNKDVDDNNVNTPISGDLSGDSGENINVPEIPEMPERDPENDPLSATNTMTDLMKEAEIEVNMPMQEAIPAETPESFIGLTSGDFAEYVVDSVVYESMISPSNQSFCIIKVNDLTKVEELKQTIFKNCDPRKWICMSAEKVVVMDSGEYIMLAMAGKENCDKLVETFKKHFDNNVGPVLEKDVEEFEGEFVDTVQ